MKNQLAFNWLIPLIGVLTLIAVGAGLWPKDGQPYPLTNFRGEQVMINARGLHHWDMVSSAAQMQANDLGMAVSMMGFNMVLAGVAANPVELVIFPTITLVNIGMAVVLLKNIETRPMSALPAGSLHG